MNVCKPPLPSDDILIPVFCLCTKNCKMAARSGKHLIQVLLQASEKSAKIARAWRCQEELFELMVEEKEEKEKNNRFVHDFKTLADVLVQEVVKNDVTREFPQLSGFIFGEESNKFTNSTGGEIIITVKEDLPATANHLVEVLCGNERAAHLLAGLIHNDAALEVNEMQVLEDKLDFELPLEKLAIWIDPIDCTSQYMSNSSPREVDGVVVSGLPCATVLIGVFHRETGDPVAGVINQPFSVLTKDSQNNNKWTGRRLWGVSYHEHLCNFLGNTDHRSCRGERDPGATALRIAISGSEQEEIKTSLSSSGAKLFTISGVGHKLLNVIDGNVDFYILSHATSFKWDTCAAHAILCSMGGGMVTYSQALSLRSAIKEVDKTSLNNCKISYHTPDNKQGKKWSNTNGVIAFHSFEKVFKLLEYLK